MTKAEIIKAAGYENEQELISMALAVAINEIKKFRDDAGKQNDVEAWDHYDYVQTALTIIRAEMNG